MNIYTPPFPTFYSPFLGVRTASPDLAIPFSMNPSVPELGLYSFNISLPIVFRLVSLAFFSFHLVNFFDFFFFKFLSLPSLLFGL